MSQCRPETGAGASRYRPTRAEISLSAFAHNVRALRSLAGASTRVMAVLKADAYGHGAAVLAKAAAAEGAAMIGVSSVEEGLSLRSAGIETPILLMGSIFPLENFAFALQAGLTPTVYSLDAAQHLAAIAKIAGRPAGFHLKVDTGMGRLGVSPAGAKSVLEWVAGEPNLRLEGIYSHLASAEFDPAFTKEQAGELSAVGNLARGLGFAGVTLHLANSAGAFGPPDLRLGMIRPGLALYGASLVPLPAEVSLRPVMTLRTAVVFMKRIPAGATVSYGRKFRAEREMEVATLPIGYGDGVPRSAVGKAQVLVKGARRPVLGVVTMDHVMIDVTGLGADVGDDVVLIGRQGEQEITAGEWAAWAGTIPYEIFCGVSKRVPRETVA